METTFEFFEVGGCVRDELIDPNTVVKDVDFTVVAHGDNCRDPFLNLVGHLESKGFKIWLLQPDFLTIRAQVPEGHVLRSRTRDADFVLARRDIDCSGGRNATVVAAGPRAMIEAFRDSGQFPAPLTDDFVSAVDQVFRRFEIRTIDSNDLLKHLFPGDAAAAPEELRERFDEYVAAATANAAQDRVRVILSTEDDQ